MTSGFASPRLTSIANNAKATWPNGLRGYERRSRYGDRRYFRRRGCGRARRCRRSGVVALVIRLGVLAAFLLSAMGAPDGRAHDIYNNGRTPATPAVSCCNDGDCRPTRARVNIDGEWEAMVDGQWIPVPWRAMLPTNYAGD